MLTEQKKTMDQEIKETRKIVCEQKETITKDIEKIKTNQTENLKPKRIICEMKTLQEEFNIRYQQAEERINEIEDN